MPRRFRIGFNARTFADGQVRGLTRHTLSLIRALRELPGDPEIHLFTDRVIAHEFSHSLRGCYVHFSEARPYLAWEQGVLVAQALKSGIDVFHSTTNVGIPRTTLALVPRVVTIHDLIGYESVVASSWLGGRDAWKAKASFAVSWQAALSADTVVTVSDYSRRKIEGRFPHLAGQVKVIHNGIDPRFSPGDPDRDILAGFGLGERYFLYVGGYEERKNVGLLIEAYAEARGRTPTLPTLALVGETSNARPELRRRLSEIPGIRLLGYVSDPKLIDLYRGAVCTVIPSLDEGFGFQSAEAMACGCPVLSSRAASLPEVGGSAAAYFDPTDRPTLASLLERAASDPVWLGELREKGLVQARQFTWKTAAEATLRIYQSLTRRISA